MRNNLWSTLAVLVIFTLVLSGLAACGPAAAPEEPAEPAEEAEAPVAEEPAEEEAEEPAEEPAPAEKKVARMGKR